MTYLKKIFCFIAVSLLVIGSVIVAFAEEIIVGYSGPLSGPATEYGQDCVNGLDMAVKEINASGGITVKGKKYTFRLEKLDDRADPTSAVNNARRLQSKKAVAIFNGLFTTISALAKLNEEKDNEFLLMAYTTTPKVVQLNNKLLVATAAPPFTVFLQIFADEAWEQGSRKAALVVTLGAYGEEWRHTFKDYWQKLGGTITIDRPANYYADTDFSAPLTAAMATNPDVMVIGGPSATTALVIEQARSMGYKKGFIIIDQAKPDYIAHILKGVKLMDNSIGVGGPLSSQLPIVPIFEKRYKAVYTRILTVEVTRNYVSMIALAKAMEAAGTVKDIRAIRSAFSKALPLLGDVVPTEVLGISGEGRLLCSGSVQIYKNGKALPTVMHFWWPKTQKEMDAFKKMTRSKVEMKWFRPKIDGVY